ncbi:GLPGLI family protein [Epilithonimonas sp.]|uniref:GLPGLI family protein n=1 Tax=Epilithonimonas sp. TaxID=2894511 RepID=UPI00289900CA|nr:GLPGLI family protein [Epilithonimonas sp.]
MNKIMTLLTFFIFIFGFSQTHRFIYEVNYKKDSTENNLTKEYYHLDINPKETLFYDRTFFESDSIIKSNPNGGFPAPNMNNIVLHKKGTKLFEDYEFIGWDVIKRASEPEQSWTLTDEKKKLGNLEIQKAVSNWGGRKWTAWFAKEIPFSEGPQKFHGLPGLIVILEDERHNYSFKLVNSRNYSKTNSIDFFQNIFPRSLFLDEAKYKKFKLNFYEDPLAYAKNGRIEITSENKLALDDGTIVTPDNIREVTLIQQKRIKKYYNPIELDNAIHYP